MEIVIDVEDETPIFSQLINQVKAAVSEDYLQAGFQMPSIRQLANDLGINQNTVAKAYKLLERDRIIVAKGYKGTFIHPQAKLHCGDDLSAQATGLLDKTIVKLRNMGLTDSEIRIAFSSIMKSK